MNLMKTGLTDLGDQASKFVFKQQYSHHFESSAKIL